MKLSPAASSSDLEVAREIAQRLHQQTQPAPPPRHMRTPRPVPPRPAAPPVKPVLPPPAATPTPPTVHSLTSTPPAVRPVTSTPPAVRPVTPPPAPVEPAPAVDAPAPEPSLWTPTGESLLAQSAAVQTPAAPELDLDAEPAPPSWDEPQAVSRGQEPEDALDALTAPTPDLTPGLATADVPTIEIEEPGEEPPESLGHDQPGLESLPDADPFGSGAEIPFEVPEALPVQPAEQPGIGPEEELFDTSPPPPSWGEITETCMALAHARGALLADSTGQLVAVRGEWPEPGPDAIASRLVAMMERTLRDAPTRSVSAPVGPQHLTAWRVPVGERLLTTAFLADSPVRADVRPSIDAEIQSGTGA
jgi:hypothetical protein